MTMVSAAPKLIPKENIKSVNGAGDSLLFSNIKIGFVGGFFAGILLGVDLATAANYGNYCASKCVQSITCEFPP